jgi:NAD(P)-dependent dehydrogenase (short-subunit alcohol dehydrogenase family)
LAREGAIVVVNGRSLGRVEQAVRRIKGENPDAQVTGMAADLSTREGVELLTGRIPTLDILVNNLGIYEVKPFAEITDEDWQWLFAVNVLSGARLSRFYLTKMLQRNWGRIVFVSSECGLNIPAEMVHYGVTKTAQIALARGLAETAAGSAVTVNSVLPGLSRTCGAERFLGGLAKAQGADAATFEREFLRTARPCSLLKRLATPEEVAAQAAYVCSPRASATNGAALRVEGGALRSIV